MLGCWNLGAGQMEAAGASTASGQREHPIRGGVSACQGNDWKLWLDKEEEAGLELQTVCWREQRGESLACLSTLSEFAVLNPKSRGQCGQTYDPGVFCAI